MEQINVFHKGIVSDIDYSNRDNKTWDFPTEGFRIVNKKGQGMVMTNIDGNEELFSINEGFYVLSAVDLNGILYIVSYNPESGDGEIGTFPSPVSGTPTNTTFTTALS